MFYLSGQHSMEVIIYPFNDPKPPVQFPLAKCNAP
jgi:hypothetical protein